jgi:hypothetical protein
MQKWEYMTTKQFRQGSNASDSDAEKMDQYLNELGEQGLELVTFANGRLILKRSI